MTKWLRERRCDLGWRGLGLGVGAIAYISIDHLAQLQAGVFGWLWATIGFLSASAGSAMLLYGAHLFDRIEVNERWRVKPPLRREAVKGAGESQAEDRQGTGPERRPR